MKNKLFSTITKLYFAAGAQPQSGTLNGSAKLIAPCCQHAQPTPRKSEFRSGNEEF